MSQITDLQYDLLELRDAHAKLRTTNEKLRRDKEKTERERDEFRYLVGYQNGACLHLMNSGYAKVLGERGSYTSC